MLWGLPALYLFGSGSILDYSNLQCFTGVLLAQWGPMLDKTGQGLPRLCYSIRGNSRCQINQYFKLSLLGLPVAVDPLLDPRVLSQCQTSWLGPLNSISNFCDLPSGTTAALGWNISMQCWTCRLTVGSRQCINRTSPQGLQRLAGISGCRLVDVGGSTVGSGYYLLDGWMDGWMDNCRLLALAMVGCKAVEDLDFNISMGNVGPGYDCCCCWWMPVVVAVGRLVPLNCCCCS